MGTCCLIAPVHRYSEEPDQCLYDEGRLHFALHVRLGDRISAAARNPDYIHHLEALMDLISLAVQEKGLASPLFHVFTQTFMPCPSEETALFDEFPSWPLEVDQVWIIMNERGWCSSKIRRLGYGILGYFKTRFGLTACWVVDMPSLKCARTHCFLLQYTTAFVIPLGTGSLDDRRQR